MSVAGWWRNERGEHWRQIGVRQHILRHDLAVELAEVLSTIIRRIRDRTETVPLVSAHDGRERLWSPPAPLLFQSRIGVENRSIAVGSVGQLLAGALTHTGLIDPLDGEALRYTPHDFRGMFITDAILNGLPPHIAQIIAGHQDINAPSATRRSTRKRRSKPTWRSWPGGAHCDPARNTAPPLRRRAAGVPRPLRAAQGLHRHLRPRIRHPCIHEHACIRPMLWPDPEQQPRLLEIRDNLQERITRPNENVGWARSKAC